MKKALLLPALFAALLFASPAPAEDFPHNQELNGDGNRNGAIPVTYFGIDPATEPVTHQAAGNALYEWEQALASYAGGTKVRLAVYPPSAEVEMKTVGEAHWACGGGAIAAAVFPYPLYDNDKPTRIVLCPALEGRPYPYVKSAISHELGHVVGLSHLTPPEYALTSLMYPYQGLNSPTGPMPVDVYAWERRWLPKSQWTVYP